MQRNVYYHEVFKRENRVKVIILDFFLNIASYPRIMLEVFLRKRMGVRYFKLSSAFTAAALYLVIFPRIEALLFSFFQVGFSRRNSYRDFEPSYWSWGLFLVVYLIFAIKRRLEITRRPSVFDFDEFSKYEGDFHPFFKNLRYNGRRFNDRAIETILEPGLCLIIGLLLGLVGIPVGWLIVFCSLCYSFSYFGAYRKGDDFIRDITDKMYLNKNLYKTFVEQNADEQAEDFRFRGKGPKAKNQRAEVYEYFFEDKEDEAAQAI